MHQAGKHKPPKKMLNFIPDSGKVPIVNLKTTKATTMDFNQ